MTLQELIDADTSMARTDKDAHGYVPIYEELFAPFRDTTLPILELGVGMGGSLRVWDAYFPGSTIHGVDIHTRPADLPEAIQYHHCNEANDEKMAEVAKHGPFAIIIDDAGHRGDEQERALLSLWGAVAPGGLYVIEDLHAAYMDEFAPSVMPVLKLLADCAVNPNGVEMAGLESVHFYRRLFVARKKSKRAMESPIYPMPEVWKNP